MIANRVKIWGQQNNALLKFAAGAFSCAKIHLVCLDGHRVVFCILFTGGTSRQNIKVRQYIDIDQ